MTKTEAKVLNKIYKFVEDNQIDCVETVYQQDSVNEQCLDFVADIVDIILQERKENHS